MESTAQFSIIADEVMSFLMSQPSLSQIADFRASGAAQDRVSYLLEANRSRTLTDAERAELELASQIEHFMSMLKIKARKAMLTQVK